ncbi:MAG: hypothetical protein LBR76_06675 [Oscillospiraceae bacterium]|nr:hypothetical protein [Oscillospiraceae bacterium]
MPKNKGGGSDMLRIRAKAPPERVLKRLMKASEPWNRAAMYKKDAFLLQIRGSRFTLTKNGGRGRTRPQRVFRGKVGKARGEEKGAEISGRFGMTTADRLFVYIPSQILLLLAAVISFSLTLMYAAVLWVACLLCSAVLIGFFTVLDRTLGAERQKEMTELLKEIGDKPA